MSDDDEIVLVPLTRRECRSLARALRQRVLKTAHSARKEAFVPAPGHKHFGLERILQDTALFHHLMNHAEGDSE